MYAFFLKSERITGSKYEYNCRIYFSTNAPLLLRLMHIFGRVIPSHKFFKSFYISEI